MGDVLTLSLICKKDALIQKIRTAIISGEYEGGERLVEARICSRYEVSRTPVREALRALAQEGLVEIVPNQGARVRKLNVKDIHDIYDVLIMTEGTACYRAAKNAGGEDITQLEEVQFHLERSIMDINLDLASNLNQKFHKTIYQIADNPYLIQIRQNFWHRIQWLARFAFSPNNPRQLEITLEQHPEMIGALKSGNAALAETLGRNHLIEGRELIVKLIRDQKLI